jgi:glyoxylase-like metal-dependent hydrolase (beta-lactamase superfamily II)
LKNPIELSKNVYLIDDHDLGMAERTGTYVLKEEKIAIIETSASPSIPYILKGLETLGISPSDIAYIIVTHIHLDHAGGAGLMLKHCPDAKVVVHPKGARHLADPSRLIQGAKAVYGVQFSQLFDPILPIPEDQLITMGNGDKLELGDGMFIQFFDTPGHADHHFSIYHPPSQGIFTGDTAGIFYPQIYREGIPFYLPSTSPNQFAPDKMLKSIEMYKELGIKKIYFGHYGMSDNPEEAFRQVKDWLKIFIEEAENAVSLGGSVSQQVDAITESILTKIKKQLHLQGLPENHPIYELLHLDVNVSAMGLVHYLNKKTGGMLK